MKTLFTIITIFMFIILLWSFPVFATTFIVSVDDPSCDDYLGTPYCSITQALIVARDGDTVLVDSGTYHEALSLDYAIKLKGRSPDLTIIDGGGANAVIDVNIHSAQVTDLEISDLTIKNGNSSQPSGIRIDRATVHTTLNNIVVTDNIGGGIDFYSDTNKSLFINNSIIKNNTNGTSGGGLYIFGGKVTLKRSIIINNVSVDGGGIFASGYGDSIDLTIQNSIIKNNIAQGWDSAGGGIHLLVPGFSQSTYQLNIYRTSIINNTSEFGGGGISLGGPQVTTQIVNSTLSGNHSKWGGGIELQSTELYLANVTLSNNFADQGYGGEGYGGGIYDWPPSASTVNFQNTIIANNFDSTPDPDCYANLNSLGYNIVTTDGSNCNVVGDLTGYLTDDPQLDSLTLFRNKRAFVHPLLAGSPAVDAGDPSYCKAQGGEYLVVDQTRHTRVDGDGDGIIVCDMGAYEFR
jgi:hypothetical protein